MSVTVSSGQTYHVTGGQTDTGDIVLFGGTLDVLSGGTSSNTVNSGGSDFIYGSGVGTTIKGGGEYVYGHAVGTVLNAGFNFSIGSVSRVGTGDFFGNGSNDVAGW